MSALIFVAVAVAWAVYLVPKALRHHEEASASRSVEHVSERVRVLARRDAVSAKATTLVHGAAAPGAAGRTSKPASPRIGPPTRAEAAAASPDSAEQPTTPESTSPDGSTEVEVEVERTVARAVAGTARPAARTPRREAARRAAQRRRRVLVTLLLALSVVAGLAIGGVIGYVWTAIPGGLIVAWLVACRLMVRRERSVAAAPALRRTAPVGEVAQDEEVVAEVEDAPVYVDEETGEVVAVTGSEPQPPAPGTWAPVAVTLPTYVGKATASRTVRTIDLDSTGVWSSGRKDEDSQLAREAEAQDRASRDARGEQSAEQRRAAGS